MKLLKLLIIPITVIYSLLNPPVIKTISIKKSENIVDSWVKNVKQNRLMFNTLFPLYEIYHSIHSFKHAKSNDQHFCLIYEHNLFIGKPTEQTPVDSFFLSHLCICTLSENKTLKVNQICLNPELIINDEKLFIQSSVNFKNDMEKFTGKHNYNVDWSEMYTWDNGRYHLLLNEDKIF